MSKKSKPETKIAFTTNAVNMVNASPLDIKVAAPPPNKWSAMFKHRAAKVQMFSHLDDRDAALVEMTTLLFDYLKEPWGLRLEAMIRL